MSTFASSAALRAFSRRSASKSASLRERRAFPGGVVLAAAGARAQALALRRHAHACVYTGLFYKDQIRDYYRANGLPEPYGVGARRKVFPQHLEQRVLAAAADQPHGGPLFRKTSCAVSYVHRGPDYSGHYGIRELCDICPAVQQRRCSRHWNQPEAAVVRTMVADLGGELVETNSRAIVVSGLDEQRRYRLQHHFGYQVHDVAKPHRRYRHGRADLGWPTTGSESL
ncbi:hypothetical protein [Amycolatopsis suaedae]|uniref:hypothetical protein n=1 Tax=Amycolatopsis suaedae TaxID=2510978 RepID=UPI0013EF49EC|nr:hypothetical protein [Amycolatopsis suaedae]